MKRHFIALFVSLLLHGALIALALYLYHRVPKPEESTPKPRLSLRSVAIPKPPLSAPSAIESPAPSPLPESPLKKSTPKESIPKPRPLPKESRPTPKPNPSHLVAKPQETPLKPPPQESPPASLPSIEQLSRKFQDSDIKELYGEEFFGLSVKEQEFLEENLKSIGAITQRYLKYPRLSGELGQEGVNAVEFYLHPNGDISDLKLLYGTSYTMLDKNSFKTIELAYKDYPRPSSKTKIRIKVFYRIYGRGR